MSFQQLGFLQEMLLSVIFERGMAALDSNLLLGKVLGKIFGPVDPKEESRRDC